MELAYVTGNVGKFKEAQLIFKEYAPSFLSLFHANLPLIEIQGTAEEIAYHKLDTAWKQLGVPLLIEDVSFDISAIGGLPGPYIRSFLESLGEDGLWTLISPYQDKRCQIICTVGYKKDEKTTQLFQGKLSGHVVAPRGETRIAKHSWNSLFVPDGFNQTFGELSFEEISRISARRKALIQLIDFIKNN